MEKHFRQEFLHKRRYSHGPWAHGNSYSRATHTSPAGNRKGPKILAPDVGPGCEMRERLSEPPTSPKLTQAKVPELGTFLGQTDLSCLLWEMLWGALLIRVMASVCRKAIKLCTKAPRGSPLIRHSTGQTGYRGSLRFKSCSYLLRDKQRYHTRNAAEIFEQNNVELDTPALQHLPCRKKPQTLLRESATRQLRFIRSKQTKKLESWIKDTEQRMKPML